MRERLIELLKKADEYASGVCIDYDEAQEVCADYLLAEGVVVPPVKTSQEELWNKNLEHLWNGVFGEVCGKGYAETLYRYWKAQEQAGYPNATENVKYFESLIAERSKR